MSPLESHLLEAIPAPARRILIIGRELLRHRGIWEQRNPLAAIDAVAGPWDISGAEGPKADAAILDIDELGGDAMPALARAATLLGPAATLALFTAKPGDETAIQPLLLSAAGQDLTMERRTGNPSGHAIWRLARSLTGRTQLRISGHELDARSGPLSPSVTRVRLLEPFEQLGSLPSVRCRTWVGDGPPAVVDPDAANILVVQRTFFVKPELYLRPAYQQNYITVAEFDDLPMVGGKFASEHCRSTLSGFHALQVSTPALASFLRQFNPEVGVFGNHLARIRPLQARGAGRPVRLLFAALGRKGGWREIVQVYRETLAGYGDAAMTTVVGDREFFDHLQPLNSSFLPVLSYAAYQEELAKADVVLLPLADTAFDRCKTDLKFLECAEAGAVALASQVVYGETVRSGETGFVYRNKYEFKKQLHTLLDEPQTRQRLAAAAHSYVREQRALANQVERLHGWYLSLVERREELDRQLKQRLGQS